jgi:hypothetical protein
VDITCRSRLLDLHTNVVIVYLDPEDDHALTRLQASMSHRIADQLRDREPWVICATVECRRDRIVQRPSGEPASSVVHREDHFSA